MRLIEKSSLDAYALQFWQRQKQKHDPNDGLAISGIERGESRVSWLANIHPYKLPKPYNVTIELVEVQAADELDRLLIHDYMARDNWMVERCLVPCQKTRRIGDMAQLALERKYFESDRDDRQIKLYKEWKDKDSLDGFIGDQEYPLLEQTWEHELEIVDGWGRLHAMSALIRRPRDFRPFKALLASRAGIEPDSV
jgi:hypothetical protein